MTCGNNIAAPDAVDNPQYLSSATELPFFIVHKIAPDLTVRQQAEYYRHATFKRAQAEARRLAGKFRGQRFVVLQACTFVAYDP